MPAPQTSRPFSKHDMRALQKHLAATPPAPGCAQPSWERLRARLNAFDQPRVHKAIAAYERGRIRSFRDLEIAASVISMLDDHDAFESCVRCHDPALVYPAGLGARRFVGTGVGPGSLNLYRALTHEGRPLLEKTYRLGSENFEHMAFAYEKVLPRLEGIRAPALVHAVAGERLVLAYFELVEIDHARVEHIAAARDTVAALRRFDPTGLELPPFARDFRHNNFRRCRTRLHARLRGDARMAARVEAWERQMLDYPVVLSHGDLNRSNFSGHGHLLDWDASGFYPYGYDPAYVAALQRDLQDLSGLEAFHARHFERPGAPREDRIAFLFFFLHFMQKYAWHHRGDALFCEIVAALERELG